MTWDVPCCTSSNVKAVVAHPGATLTELQMKTARAGGQSCLDTMILNSTMDNAQSVEDGAMGFVRGCFANNVNNGDFFGPKGIKGPAELLPREDDGPLAGPVDQDRLWGLSLNATGLGPNDFFGGNPSFGDESKSRV